MSEGLERREGILQGLSTMNHASRRTEGCGLESQDKKRGLCNVGLKFEQTLEKMPIVQSRNYKSGSLPDMAIPLSNNGWDFPQTKLTWTGIRSTPNLRPGAYARGRQIGNVIVVFGCLVSLTQKVLDITPLARDTLLKLPAKRIPWRKLFATKTKSPSDP
jgi:hypothetical protein